VTSSKNKIKPTNYQLGKYNHNLRVSATELQELLNGDNCLLIDARTPEEYRGEIYLQAPPQAREKAGHIPGAINIYYELAHNNDSTFKSAEELHELYGNLISTDKTIIPYCAVGARSAHTWFILKYLLGYDRVQNYDGSWNEWSRLNDVAIAY
ncbi:MAG: rhodanese-like domain-containing protein, partial [Cyanobacteria bacterium J06649_11]